jgi:hypothetical protein
MSGKDGRRSDVEIGAGWPAIIWNAGIISIMPATIETPGASVPTASKSMTIPKERPRSLSSSQSSVKWPDGASSYSRCSTTEVGTNAIASSDSVGFNSDLPTFHHQAADRSTPLGAADNSDYGDATNPRATPPQRPGLSFAL